jgi:hypothetical protein
VKERLPFREQWGGQWVPATMPEGAADNVFPGPEVPPSRSSPFAHTLNATTKLPQVLHYAQQLEPNPLPILSDTCSQAHPPPLPAMNPPTKNPAADATNTECDVDEKGNYWAPATFDIERQHFPLLFATAQNEANALAKQCKYPEAILYFGKALQFQPRNVHLLSARSHCKYLCGDHAGALKDVGLAGSMKLPPGGGSSMHAIRALPCAPS